MTKEMNFDELKINCQDDVRTIGSMKSELKAGRATYCHWHTLLYDFINLHSKIKDTADYGILMPEVPMFGKVSCYELEGKMSQGGYNQKAIASMLEMYEFLYNENIQIQPDRGNIK